MYRLSTPQLLTLWSRLEACFYGKNSYAGDTAEIYQYTLMPSCPSVEAMQRGGQGPAAHLRLRGSSKSIMQETADEVFKDASEALHNVLLYFIHSKEIDRNTPGVRITIEEREFGAWVKDLGQWHRLHVKVENLRG
jgi:hypothetical protein